MCVGKVGWLPHALRTKVAAALQAAGSSVRAPKHRVPLDAERRRACSAPGAVRTKTARCAAAPGALATGGGTTCAQRGASASVGETCPISTEGWTRRVHFVREGGGWGGGGLCREGRQQPRVGPLSEARAQTKSASLPRFGKTRTPAPPPPALSKALPSS